MLFDSFAASETPFFVVAFIATFFSDFLIGFLAWATFFVLLFLVFATPDAFAVTLFLESAFSICLGCKIYNIIMPEKATHCQGGVCEIKKKDKIQTFNMIQKLILLSTVLIITIGTYTYIYKLENKTMLGKMLSIKMMSAEDIKLQRDKKFQQESAEFDDDSDF